MRTLLLTLALLLPAMPATADVRVGVFGLFHPRELVARPATDSSLVLQVGGSACTLAPRAEARLVAAGGRVRAICGGRTLEATTARIASPVGGIADLELSVPAKIARPFRGRVDVSTADLELVPVVTMELEVAVASVVAAELPDRVPLEARKALAVAARSFFVAARQRHRGFDFCDTTHCQFLREPPAASHPATRAAIETRGLVLTFHGNPIVALYSASCGGHTRSLVEAGLDPGDDYPYFGVACPYCERHASSWERRLPLDESALQLEAAPTEHARLVLGRRRGWSSVPGGNFTTSREAGELVLQGRGAGHGIGLCQLGAAGRATAGERFLEILAAYYPGTALATFRTQP